MTKNASPRSLGAYFAAAVCVATASAQPLWAQTVPRCLETDVKIVSKVESAYATAGDPFTFKVAQRVVGKGTIPNVPLGTRGYGVVSFADHAHGSGSPGRLVIEPRFLVLANGTHVPVISNPQLSESFVAGATRNVNGALGFVPGVGLAIGGYNALHRGKEVVIEPGTPFRIVLGDDLPLGQCFVPPPSAPDVR